jgi:hypothetical protein
MHTLLQSTALQDSLRLIPFWGLCVAAAVSSGVSFALFIASASPGPRFLVALFATATASAVQKYALAGVVGMLQSRRHLRSAVLLSVCLGFVPFPFLLASLQSLMHQRSAWTHTAFASVSVLKGRTLIAQEYLLGVVGVNQLVLGACFAHGGHRLQRARSALVSALTHSRIIIASSVVAIFPTAFRLSFEGELD